jgi:hypothetical protein
MEKLEPIFGFECTIFDDELISIDVKCDFPQQKVNCKKLYTSLEQLKIIESGITFPLRLKHWTITKSATDKFTIMNYFRINGIKKVVEEQIQSLIGHTTFIKPEVQYGFKKKYPNLHIHFYQITDVDGIEVLDEKDMTEKCMIHYENTKQFTAKRLADLEPFVNPLELQCMSFFPMELVEFDEVNDNKIKDFYQHSIMLRKIELPF